MTTTNQHDALNRLTAVNSSSSSFSNQYNPANQRPKNTLADGSDWVQAPMPGPGVSKVKRPVYVYGSTAGRVLAATGIRVNSCGFVVGSCRLHFGKSYPSLLNYRLVIRRGIARLFPINYD